jgi:hypothetical protein
MEPAAEKQPLKHLIASAERTLRETLGGPVRLEDAGILRGSDRARVVRCRVADGPQGSPASVIVKQVLGEEGRPYDPDDAPRSSTARRFFNDWTGAQFLSVVAVDAALAPRVYGGDRAQGFIILEDFGEGESLADLLQGDDGGRAEQGLLAFAVTLGRMHAATVGREAEYQRLREALERKPSDPPAADAPPYSRFHEACAALEFALPGGVAAELERVAASMRAPGPFLAYTHGDPCPGNDRCADGRLRLFDFEFGRFRHALCDGVYGRVPFPTCWCVNRLPTELPPRMEAVYRAELVKGCPEAGDDVLFRRAVVEAVAHWTVETAGWHLTAAIREDSTWGIATIRQRLLVRLDNLAALTKEYGHLGTLGTAAREIAAQLRALWPPEADQMPLYPAFRNDRRD